MNDFIKNEIDDAVATLSFKLGEMSLLEAKFFRERMASKFLKDGIDAFPLWERVLFPRFSVRDVNAIDWLDEFIRNQETIMFFHKDDHSIIYNINKGQSLSLFLNEIPYQMYHFTNESLDYLICFSDANYLIAAGTAEPWLRNKAIELSKTGWKDMDGKSFDGSIR